MQKKNNHSALAGKLAVALSLWMAYGAAYAVQTWSSSACATGSTTVACASGLSVEGYSTAYLNNSKAKVGTSFVTANVNNSSGLGVVASSESSTDGSNYIDSNAGTDALLLNFTTASTLTSLNIGWSGDSDLSIFAWTNTGAPSVTNFGPSSLTTTGSGWSLIGNFFNAGQATGGTVTVPSTPAIYSSYWLVSAYNSYYGVSTPDSTVDAFKILAISAQNCVGAQCPTATSAARVASVPEPGSMALIGAAFLGMLAVRRKSRSAAG